MKRSVTFFLVSMMTGAQLISGCAMMTMPRANQAVGQLRIGNERGAWELISSELSNPRVKTDLELCEVHGIAVQILQQIINKDFVPSNAEEIAKSSYDYVCTSCRDFNLIIGLTEFNYGRVLMSRGKPGLAIPHVKKAIRYVQKGAFDHIMQEKMLSEIYSSLGRFELRDHHSESAITIARNHFATPRTYRWNTEEGNEWMAFSAILFSRISDLSWAEEKPERIPVMKQLFAELERIVLVWGNAESKYKIYASGAQFFAQAGELSFANELFQKARDLVNKMGGGDRGRMDLMVSEAQLLRFQGKQDQAGRLMLEWITHYRQAYNGEPNDNAYRLAGLAMESAADYDNAIRFFEASISSIEEMRSSFAVELRDSLIGGPAIAPYWGLMRSYATKYLKGRNERDFQGALRAAKLFRARQFGEMLGLDIEKGKGLDYAALNLAPGETLLDLVFTDEVLIIFSFSDTDHNLFLVPYDKQRLRSAVQKVRSSISGSRDPGIHMKELLYLSNLVLGPIRGNLAGIKRLIVIPDGLLHGIPFCLLSESPDKYQPLLLEHEVTLTPSLAYLTRVRGGNTIPPSDRIFALGDPSYGERQTPQTHRDETEAFYKRAVDHFGLFDPLPETRVEVQNVAALFGASKTTLLLGERASESGVKATDLSAYRYLHFATHGVLGNQVPGLDEPALVLAAEPESANQDGFLTLSEVQKLRLNSELSVLSACDTGSGDFFTGEGIMGLSRGFLLAGSRSVLVSLWPVASEATVELMRHFYKNLQEGKSIGESLRAAQMTMMLSPGATRGREKGLRVSPSNGAEMLTLHPFFWAAFELVGD